MSRALRNELVRKTQQGKKDLVECEIQGGKCDLYLVTTNTQSLGTRRGATIAWSGLGRCPDPLLERSLLGVSAGREGVVVGGGWGRGRGWERQC